MSRRYRKLNNLGKAQKLGISEIVKMLKWFFSLCSSSTEGHIPLTDITAHYMGAERSLWAHKQKALLEHLPNKNKKGKVIILKN